jgi:hypothetical protein
MKEILRQTRGHGGVNKNGNLRHVVGAKATFCADSFNLHKMASNTKL